MKDPRVYNPPMLHDLNVLLGAAAMERLTLFTNHLIASEPIALRKLALHSGRCMQLFLADWPKLLPPPPVAAFRITPAGLLEWCGGQGCAEPDLRLTLVASNPALELARAVAGSRPKVDVAGDALLATDLNWLFDNLRWDVEDDLSRIVGQAPAREISRVVGGIVAGLREVASSVTGRLTSARNAAAEPPRQ
ncbi:MAG: hypothetical protein ABI702_13045 [Burkholderiales bacterium]